MKDLFTKQQKRSKNQKIADDYFSLEIARIISMSVVDAESPNDALEIMARTVQKWLPFDQLAVFTKRQDGLLELAFARSIVNSPSLETDRSWGDTMARRAIDGGKSFVYESKRVGDLTGDRESLSIPLILKKIMTGALVIIRYHGPIFTDQEIQVANFLGSQVLQIMNSQELADRLADLEAKKHLSVLQDEFIALISHELLTPLGFIKGYATTLLREDVDWDRESQQEFLMIIDEETDRLRQTIEELLDSSRLKAGTLPINLQPLNLKGFMNDIVIRAKTRDDHLDLEMKFYDHDMRIMGDSTRLTQVMDNLFSNASKYAPDSTIRIEITKEHEHIKISFSDSGPGIPLDHLNGLFQRFYRVPDSSKSIRGTGLGLFICKQIIEAHHGKIDVESTPGKGVTLNIFLPLFEQLVDHKL